MSRSGPKPAQGTTTSVSSVPTSTGFDNNPGVQGPEGADPDAGVQFDLSRLHEPGSAICLLGVAVTMFAPRNAGRDSETVTYELRVIPDCPNSTAALELFRRALAAESTAAGRPGGRAEQRGAGTVPDFQGPTPALEAERGPAAGSERGAVVVAVLLSWRMS